MQQSFINRLYCKKNKPIILSTGMNDIKSVKKSVDIINKYHNQLALLHCTNVYPASFESLRLNSILELKRNLKILLDIQITQEAYIHQ